MKWIKFDSFLRARWDNPEYKKLLFELENKLNNATNIRERKEIFSNFANAYTVIPEIWDTTLRRFAEDGEYVCHLTKASFSHFYSPNNYGENKELFKNRDTDFDNFLKILLSSHKMCYYDPKNIDSETFLTFPNESLEDNYRAHVEQLDRPIPQEIKTKYQKAKKFSKQLKRCAENCNHKKFIEVCFDYGDDQFAYQSIECRIWRYCYDKRLWQAYINAVKDRNVKIMLNIYHRYKRLFLNDKEMQEKYEDEKKIVQKDPNFDNLPNLENYLFEEIKPKTTYITQILNTSSAKIRFKLFQACKLLFLQKPTPICYQLIIARYGFPSENRNYSCQSLLLQNSELNVKMLSKLFISNRFKFQYPDLWMLSREIIPKLDKCEAQYIQIFQQIITFDDFKFLVTSQTKKFEYFNGGIVGRGDGKVVPVEKLLPFLTFAYDIRSLLDVDDYCNFIMNNAAKGAKFNLAFGNKVSAEDVANFDKMIAEFTNANFYPKNPKNPKRLSRRVRSAWGRFYGSSKSGPDDMRFLESNISKFNLKPVTEM